LVTDFPVTFKSIVVGGNVTVGCRLNVRNCC